jgi:ABC-type antimicrobial peptide transport system permease subunit
MRKKVSVGLTVLLSLTGILVGIIITLFILTISPFITFLPFGVKVALVDTREYENDTDFNWNEGYVQDPETAIKIAEAVWLDIYGEDIYNEKPFDAVLENDVWTVRGTLPILALGGTAEIKISKQDGRILEVYHGK